MEKYIARLPAWARGPAEILAEAAEGYGRHRDSRMAAAIAYRTVFALAPLLIIAVAVLGTFLGSESEAQQEILDAIEALAGPEVAEAVRGILTSALSSTGTAYVIGGVLLLWTASSLFLELQRDLNDIFEVPHEEVSGILAMARTRGIGFLWVLGLGFLLVATWSLNAAWSLIADLLPDDLSTVNDVMTLVTPLISVILLPLVFGLIFKTMTLASVPWRAVWAGGLFTAVVFLGAAYGVGVYFSIAGATTALGFAGSFVVILFLAYFLAMVFLFGAEVTKAYAGRLAERAAATEREASPKPLYTDPQVVVAEPPSGIPRAAFLAFLAGIIAGWRSSRR
jgi:membrane protein